MLEFSLNKSFCTGCTACRSICPKKCIRMIEDEEGFLYPVNDETCIHCGLCEKICPIQNPIQGAVNVNQLVFACKSKSFDIWKTSASGGAFTEICKCFGDSKTLVFGAAYDGLSVKHVGIKGVDNVYPLRKSKYVASDLKDTFIEAKTALLENNKVIFCGTPCQIAGLRKFLGKDYPNLLLIDFVCHGVGSQDVWRNCVELTAHKFKKKPIGYFFREKRSVFEDRYIQRIVFEDGTSSFLGRDLYHSLFLNQICLRPSCGESCAFRTQNRQSDISLADYKNIDADFKNDVDKRYNYTAVVFNTNKSLALIDCLRKSSELIQSSLESIKRDNPLFFTQTKTNIAQRNKFFADYGRNKKRAIIRWSKKNKTRKKGQLILKIRKIFGIKH